MKVVSILNSQSQNPPSSARAVAGARKTRHTSISTVTRFIHSLSSAGLSLSGEWCLGTRSRRTQRLEHVLDLATPLQRLIASRDGAVARGSVLRTEDQ